MIDNLSIAINAFTRYMLTSICFWDKWTGQLFSEVYRWKRRWFCGTQNVIISFSCDSWAELPTITWPLVMWQFEKRVLPLFDQEGPRDRTSTSASTMWEARAYKSPYENSHYTRPTKVLLLPFITLFLERLLCFYLVWFGTVIIVYHVCKY